ncbi:MAG: DNA repair exonuclease [Chloroflexi bacterium]|nr:DNA repair exonuclease [Chloroflexota bacterium]
MTHATYATHHQGGHGPAGPRRPVRILHTSDVHLYGADSCSAFARVVEAANRLGADLLLVAGDLFDSNRVDREVVRCAVAALGRLAGSAVLLPGNHDQLDPSSVYHRMGLDGLRSRVHLITAHEGETVEFPELGLAVWGRAMQEHLPSFRPLGGVPARNGAPWYVGVAHGLCMDAQDTYPRSSPIFSEEIVSSGFDYLALGHVHQFTEVSRGNVRAAYSGAPAPVYAGERAGEVALVHLDPVQGVKVERVVLPRAPLPRLSL